MSRVNKWRVTIYDKFFKKELTGVFEGARQQAIKEAREYYACELGDLPENMIVTGVEMVKHELSAA